MSDVTEVRHLAVVPFIQELCRANAELRATTVALQRNVLEWQLKAGMNTVGMLIAHVAIVQVYWVIQIINRGNILEAQCSETSQRVLGLGLMDDGVPLQPDGSHPPLLEGQDSPFYASLLRKAEEYVRLQLAPIVNLDPASEFYVDGKSRSVEWILWHILSHSWEHTGQVRLMVRARDALGSG